MGSGPVAEFSVQRGPFNVTLIGRYTDFGRFLADFENSFPYMRVQLMNVSPDVQQQSVGATTTPGDDGGKLRFNFRVISLIKTQT